MKYFLIVLAVALLFSAGSASAHVLIKDKSGTKGAILHIQPDDDPIAGEPATLYFDMQNKNANTVQLTIANDNTKEVTTLKPAKTKGSLVTLTYTFPAQGIYTLTFATTSGSETHTFKTHQRVSRGVASGSITKSYVWAEALLLGSGVATIILATTFVRERRAISAAAKLSK